jgi:hypothetical protein
VQGEHRRSEESAEAAFSRCESAPHRRVHGRGRRHEAVGQRDLSPPPLPPFSPSPAFSANAHEEQRRHCIDLGLWTDRASAAATNQR